MRIFKCLLHCHNPTTGVITYTYMLSLTQTHAVTPKKHYFFMHLHIVTNIQWSCFMFSYKTLHVLLQLATLQCDQMARLFFNIWPFTLMQTCPMAYKICQSGSKMFLNSTLTLKNCPIFTQIFHLIYFLSFTH